MFSDIHRLLGCTAAAMLPKQSMGAFRKHITTTSEQDAEMLFQTVEGVCTTSRCLNWSF